MEAVQIAKATFKGRAYKEGVRLVMSERLAGRIVVDWNGKTEESAALVDPIVFDTDPLHGASAGFYWQRIPYHGVRLALLTSAGRNRGMSSVYVVLDDVTAEQFWESHEQHVTHGIKMKFSPAIQDSWNIPVVIEDMGFTWFIDTVSDFPNGFWKVYSPKDDGTIAECTIRF